MCVPGHVLDLQIKPSARFARHERLWPCTRRTTRPVRARFDSWTMVRRELAEVHLVRRLATQCPVWEMSLQLTTTFWSLPREFLPLWVWNSGRV